MISRSIVVYYIVYIIGRLFLILKTPMGVIVNVDVIVVFI